eukprot:1161252-Pelagomonas_calceolata.AAC.5
MFSMLIAFVGYGTCLLAHCVLQVQLEQRCMEAVRETAGQGTAPACSAIVRQTTRKRAMRI